MISENPVRTPIESKQAGGTKTPLPAAPQITENKESFQDDSGMAKTSVSG
jgi:hypothetical protein